MSNRTRRAGGPPPLEVGEAMIVGTGLSVNKSLPLIMPTKSPGHADNVSCVASVPQPSPEAKNGAPPASVPRHPTGISSP